MACCLYLEVLSNTLILDPKVIVMSYMCYGMPSFDRSMMRGFIYQKPILLTNIAPKFRRSRSRWCADPSCGKVLYNGIRLVVQEYEDPPWFATLNDVGDSDRHNYVAICRQCKYLGLLSSEYKKYRIFLMSIYPNLKIDL